MCVKLLLSSIYNAETVYSLHAGFSTVVLLPSLVIDAFLAKTEKSHSMRHFNRGLNNRKNMLNQTSHFICFHAFGMIFYAL